MDEILHHLTTLPWKGRIATPAPLIQCWRDSSEEVVQDFGPSTCFNFLTVVAPMLYNEGERAVSLRYYSLVSLLCSTQLVVTVSFHYYSLLSLL